MKKLLYLIPILLLTHACNRQKKQQTSTIDSTQTVVHIPAPDQTNTPIDNVIIGFAEAYIQKNKTAVNQYIHPDLGLKIIYRPGVSDTFEKTKELDFAHPVPDHYPYAHILGQGKLLYEPLPQYDCGQMCWSKLGFYCDTLQHPVELSRIIKFEMEFNKDSFNQQELNKTLQDEAQSFRIIMTTEEPLIFHIQKYIDKWYVTTLDRAYASCDA